MASVVPVDPYVREHTDGVGYEIDEYALSTYGVREKIWERYTYVEDMSAAEGRKLESDAPTDVASSALKAFIKSRK